MWLVRLQRTNAKAGSPPPPGYAPMQTATMVSGGEFTAFGRRQGFDCYLFIHRTDAEIFKKRVEDNPKSRKSLKRLKPQIHIVEVTPEDAARLDLDPIRRKSRVAAPQI